MVDHGTRHRAAVRRNAAGWCRRYGVHEHHRLYGCRHSSGERRHIALAQQWNGKIWRTVPTPLPGGNTIGQLEDVSCTSASNCFAVGSLVANQPTKIVIHWNGKSWSPTKQPLPLANAGYGGTISCWAASDCVFLGAVSDSHGLTRPVSQRFHNGQWTRLPFTLSPSTTLAGPYAVTCRAGSWCRAVGYRDQAGVAFTPLAAMLKL